MPPPANLVERATLTRPAATVRAGHADYGSIRMVMGLSMSSAFCEMNRTVP